jgi:hypothetical protein
VLTAHGRGSEAVGPTSRLMRGRESEPQGPKLHAVGAGERAFSGYARAGCQPGHFGDQRRVLWLPALGSTSLVGQALRDLARVPGGGD